MARRSIIWFLAAAIVAAAPAASGQTKADTDEGYVHIKDIPYTSAGETDPYKTERCKLDLYFPEGEEGFPTLVWFHGGGLETGSKSLQDGLYIFRHIGEYGGDTSRIYVGGHSAGGYLTLMLVLCPEYMDRFGADAGLIRKAYPVSGQTFTHFTIKKERGMPMDLPFIDEYAPVNNVRQDGAPLMLITGDRELEMLCRYEENECLLAILKHFRHPAELYELDGFDHGNVVVPACILIRNDIHRDCRTGD